MVLLLVTTLSFLALDAIANDAPMKLMSGTVAPYLGAMSNIRMDSETVSISLGDKSYIVDATFNFINLGNTDKIHVGFPKRGYGYLDNRFQHADEFMKFEAWVDGKPVDVSEKPDMSTVKGDAMTLPKLLEALSQNSPETSLYATDNRWMVRAVEFPAKKKTTTRVRYEATYQDFGNCYGARYIFGTGSYWKGNIGKSKFIINCVVSEGQDMCRDQIQDAGRGKKYNIARKKTKKDVVQYEMKNYKPDADDQIFMTVGCPE